MASKSTNQTILTLGVVGVGGFLAIKYIGKKFGGGGGNGTTLTGPAGGGTYAPPYYDQQQQGLLQSLLNAISRIGGGRSGGGGSPSAGNYNQGTSAAEYGQPYTGGTIAGALQSGLYDGAGGEALATIYNAQTGFGTNEDAPIDYASMLQPLELSSAPQIAEVPVDSGSSFLDWFNGGGSATDLPSGSIGDATAASDESAIEDYSGGDYNVDSSGSDIADYSGYGVGDSGGYSDGYSDSGDGGGDTSGGDPNAPDVGDGGEEDS